MEVGIFALVKLRIQGRIRGLISPFKAENGGLVADLLGKALLKMEGEILQGINPRQQMSTSPKDQR